MSNGAVWILIALAQQLKALADKIGAGETPGVPGQPPSLPPILPVQIAPEPSQVITEIDSFEGNETAYTEILSWKVTAGYTDYINELSIAPDTNAKTYGRFLIKVGSKTLTDVRLRTTISLKYDWLRLYEGSIVSVHYKTTDNTKTIAGNVSLTGRRVSA